MIAPFTVEGACNRTVFETWLETCAMPVLCPGDALSPKILPALLPGIDVGASRLSKPRLARFLRVRPREWVIIDNATFHHGGRIAQLIEAAGAQVVYLPPYSPDFNRIEKCWATLKARIRKQLRQFDNLHDAIDSVLKQAAS